MIAPKLDFSLKSLEACVADYLAGPTSEPFDLSVVPKAAVEQLAAAKAAAAAAASAVPGLPSAPEPNKGEAYAALLSTVPQLAALGPLFKSSEPLQLTEEETEYSINVVKHVFESHLVLQFNCTNTVVEQLLQDVTVEVDLADAVCGGVGVGVLGCGRYG